MLSASGGLRPQTPVLGSRSALAMCPSPKLKFWIRQCAGRPKIGDGHYLHLQIQFGEDLCTQFRVIVVIDPQSHKHTNKQTGPITIHCAAGQRTVCNQANVEDWLMMQATLGSRAAKEQNRTEHGLQTHLHAEYSAPSLHSFAIHTGCTIQFTWYYWTIAPPRDTQSLAPPIRRPQRFDLSC